MSESDAAGMALTWMDFQPGEYEARLEQKLADLRRMFATVLPEGMPVDTFASAPTHFRQRARFALARLSDDERLHYALYNRGEPQRIEPSFPVASREINMLMPLLLDAINASEALAAGIAALHRPALSRLPLQHWRPPGMQGYSCLRHALRSSRCSSSTPTSPASARRTTCAER